MEFDSLERDLSDGRQCSIPLVNLCSLFNSSLFKEDSGGNNNVFHMLVQIYKYFSFSLNLASSQIIEIG